MWHAELVGVVRAYPPTQEEYDRRNLKRKANIARLVAEGRWTRAGVYNGQSRRQKKIDRADTRKAATRERREGAIRHHARIAIHKAAFEQAPAELKRMMDENFINSETIADAELGNIALKFVTAVVMDGAASLKDRLAAVKILAEFTKVKPATKSEVAFKNSEDFLASLLEPKK